MNSNFDCGRIGCIESFQILQKDYSVIVAAMDFLDLLEFIFEIPSIHLLNDGWSNPI